jgi:curli production assembly/transport component CsgF
MKRARTGLIWISVIAGMVMDAAPSGASSLLYEPVNPAFGGSPLNGNFLMDSAGVQNQHKPVPLKPTAQTPSQRFLQTLQNRLLSEVSGQIAEMIFGEDAQEAGVFQFEGTTINFQREGPNVRLTINDGISMTDIVVPAGN